MTDMPLSRCTWCGQPFKSLLTEYCPVCRYPLHLSLEEQFLETMISLGYVADYGKTGLSEVELFQHYQMRLEKIRRTKTRTGMRSVQLPTPLIKKVPDFTRWRTETWREAPEQHQAAAPPQPEPSTLLLKPSSPSTAEKAPDVMVPIDEQTTIDERDSVSTVPSPEDKTPVPPPFVEQNKDRKVPVSQPVPPDQHSQPVAPAPLGGYSFSQPVPPPYYPPLRQPPTRQTATRTGPTLPERILSWRAFLQENVITIIGLITALIIGIGAFGFITTTNNPHISFIVVLILHIFFGIPAFVLHRFKDFKLISRIYGLISSFVAPLVIIAGLSILGVNTALPVTTVTASYAAVICILLATTQRFTVFAYLGLIALITAVLAFAQSLDVAICWWASILMVLAFLAYALTSGRAGTARRDSLTSSWAILYEPIRVVILIVVGLCALGALIATLYAFTLDPRISEEPFAVVAKSHDELRLAIFSVLSLLFLWLMLFVRPARPTTIQRTLPYFFMGYVLIVCYTFFPSQPTAYVLALTATALLYHSLTRQAGHWLSTSLTPSLNWLAIAMVSTVFLINAFAQTSLSLAVNLITVGGSLLITISTTLHQASSPTSQQKNAWPWLLLLAGLMFHWEYNTLLGFSFPPTWSFLGPTIGFVVLAVLVRRYIGAYWANPLDAIVLVEVYATLGIGSSPRPSDLSDQFLLPFFAVLFYTILLYQRRRNWLFLPFALGLLTPLAFAPYNTQTSSLGLFCVSLLFPLLSAGIRLLIPPGQRGGAQAIVSRWSQLLTWEWPPLLLGFLCGLLISILQVEGSAGPFLLHFPVEMALIAGAWYIAAGFGRVKWWLLPTTFFAISALISPFNLFNLLSRLAEGNQLSFALPFEVVVGVTIGTALLGLVVSRFTETIWASPTYIVALLGTVITGIVGQNQGLLTTWVLLGFAVLAYIIGIAENLLPCLLLVPILATWSMFDSILISGQAGLLQVLIVALVSAFAARSSAFLVRVLPVLREREQHNKLWYVLPFYTTTVAAGVLTGLAGSVFYSYPQSGLAPTLLLLYAGLAYLIGAIENQTTPLWFGTFFATWSLIDFALLDSFFALPTVTLACVALGILCTLFYRRTPGLRARNGRNAHWYTLPFYVTALVGASITGIYSTINMLVLAKTIITPETVIATLFLYAAIAYSLALFEKRPNWLGIVACFGIWAILLRANNMLFITMIGVAIGLGGLIISRASRASMSNKAVSANVAVPVNGAQFLRNITWSWPCYIIAGVASGVAGLSSTTSSFYSLLAFSLLAVVIMLVEGIPEMLVLPVGLATWSIWLSPTPLLGHIFLSSLLCAVVFASQFIWKVVPSTTNWLPPTQLHCTIGFAGLLVLILINTRLLTDPYGWLDGLSVELNSLALLALLLLWYGYLRRGTDIQHWCYYIAGFVFFSLTIPGATFLLAVRSGFVPLTDFLRATPLLTAAPAAYLTLIAPFIKTDTRVPMRRFWGYCCEIVGPTLLWLPTLLLTLFLGTTFPFYIGLLIGIALTLILLGIGFRSRFFILTGVGLFVVAFCYLSYVGTKNVWLTGLIVGVTASIGLFIFVLIRRHLQSKGTVW
jgi:hypothetical protein